MSQRSQMRTLETGPAALTSFFIYVGHTLPHIFVRVGFRCGF